MRRTPLKRKSGLKAKKTLKVKSGLKTRTKLLQKGKSTTSKIKEQIQAQLRRRVIARDGGCVLRNHPEAGLCGGYKSDGELILQAEHLNGRANSVSYAELDNVICLCQYHHIFFKKQNNALYWVLVRRHLGDRWANVEKFITDKSPHRMTAHDWRVALDSLIYE